MMEDYYNELDCVCKNVDPITGASDNCVCKNNMNYEELSIKNLEIILEKGKK